MSSVLPDEAARRRVIAELDTTFLVEAGAGTGKTNVLLQRLLALVRTGRGWLERMGAITFTEKAAAELRVRLRTEIDIALAEPLTADERSNLRAARVQLERAAISTVHAFCAALLRERPVEARVDPHFTVLDRFDAGLLRAEVWQEWLAREMDRSPDILKQALRAGLTLAHLETLRDIVVEQRDCLSLLPAPVASALPELRTTLTSSIARLAVLKASCVTTTDRALERITALIDSSPAGEDDLPWERLLCRNLPSGTRLGAKANWRPAAVLDEVRELLNRIGEAHARARSAWFHNLTIALAHWLEEYVRAYEEKKREQSSLDFTDLLLRIRDLLKHNLDVRRYFQSRFDFLLVDEFQDTDPLQAEIVFFLAEREPRAVDWATAELRPGKLFLVGDPQQSIYRFRRADLEVYAQVRAAIERQGEVLSLSTNFRTRAPALNWINETFERVFASIGTDQPAYRPLTAARHEDTGREVILLPVSADLLSAHPNREELRQAEARTVAAFLKQAVTYGSLTVWGDRTVHYRDIGVLFRTYQAMDAYEEALRSAGVPYRVFGGRRYTSRQEVEELHTLLRAIESPSHTTALVATLRSCLFGFSDEELVRFVSEGGSLDYMRVPVPDSLSAADRFTAAFVLLHDLHTRHTQISPAALLSEIYDRTHLLPLFALRPQGAQRVANLLRLIDIARGLAARGLYTLTAFNRFLDQQENMDIEEGSVIAEEHDDALRLLTIHKAKGLEFPVVILADAVYSQGGRPGRTGIIERIGGSLELQVGPRSLICTTQGWQKAEAREQERDAAEERRLWYVAAARVRHHLIIPVPPEGGSRSSTFALHDFETGPEVSQKGSQVFVHHSSAPTVDQTAPRLPGTPMFTRIEPDPITLRAYQEWEAEQRAMRATGQQAE